MPAKKNNKYAEKWPKASVLYHLENIYNDVRDNKIFYLGVALANEELYADIWQYWLEKWGKDEEVFRLTKRIEAKLEANLISQSAHNKINATIAIFVLKNKYKWSDKQEIDHTSKGESIVWNEVKTYPKGGNS